MKAIYNIFIPLFDHACDQWSSDFAWPVLTFLFILTSRNAVSGSTVTATFSWLAPKHKHSELIPKRRGVWAPTYEQPESTTTEGAPVAEGL